MGAERRKIVVSMDNKIINGVWCGVELTNLEKLSIRSFLSNGHEFHLYTTHPDCRGIPEGTVVHATSEVVPEDAHTWFTGPNHFSDYFRSHLICKKGGWYVDVDIVCLKPFDFPEPYVLLCESPDGGVSSLLDPAYLTGCLFKAPAEAPFLQNIVNEIESRNPQKGCDLTRIIGNINAGIGPGLFRKWVPKAGLQDYYRDSAVFDAIGCLDGKQYVRFVSGGQSWSFPEKSRAIHLRCSYWQHGNLGLNPNKNYPEDSLYEQLKKKYGVK